MTSWMRWLSGPVPWAGMPSARGEFLKQTRLKEHQGEYPEASEMLAQLLADHEATVRQLRVDLETCANRYHDMGTNDFLSGLMERHEKMAWMVRSYLEGHSG